MASNNAYNPYNQVPPSPSGNGYAARSAQAYGNQPQQQYMQQQQQQQQQQHMQQQQQPPPNQPIQQQQYYTPAPPVSQKMPAANNYNPQPQYGQVNTPSTYSSINTPNSSLQHIQEKNQQHLLDASIRRMQEATHIMRGAMDADDLPTTLDRASAMLGELGDPKHHHHHSHSHSHNHSHGHNTKSSSSTSSAIMSPKHYYEIHMLAMEELPNIEEYLLSLSSGPSPRYTMKGLYEVTQYTSRAVPRLYLQICAGSALIRSGEEDVTNVLNDLIQAVKCVQCPIRGLFLRDYLLKAVRDKLPDEVEQDDVPVPASPSAPAPIATPIIQQEEEVKNGNMNEFEDINIAEPNTTMANLMGDLTVNANTGIFSDGMAPMNQEEKIQENNVHANINSNLSTGSDTPQPLINRVKDSYQFVLANFIEMNKLWVRIQHLPGDAKNKETKRRRERERNELRMMVGTNLVRLSELEGVTSAIYGTVILPRILDQIIACRDPLAQAYLMDCIIQVFPDEFHIQTLEVVLSVCSKLRDKVNVRTILQSIMDRLSNYYADELLLNDEEDTEGVKTSVMLDSFEMFDNCIQSVFEARGAKINAKEVIRLESSLLDFSLKCYPGRMDHLNKCLGACASCLRGEGTSLGALAAESGAVRSIPMDEVAVKELEKLLSLPLETMGLNILYLDQYSELLTFLPLDHRKRVGVELLNVLYLSGEKMTELAEIEQLFTIISPLILGNNNTGNPSPQDQEEKESISKLIHLLYNEDTDVHFEILNFVKKYLFSSAGGLKTSSYTVSPLFYSAMKLMGRVQGLEFPKPVEDAQVVEDVDEMQKEEENIEDDGEQDTKVDDKEVEDNKEEEVTDNNEEEDEPKTDDINEMENLQIDDAADENAIDVVPSSGEEINQESKAEDDEKDENEDKEGTEENDIKESGDNDNADNSEAPDNKELPELVEVPELAEVPEDIQTEVTESVDLDKNEEVEEMAEEAEKPSSDGEPETVDSIQEGGVEEDLVGQEAEIPAESLVESNVEEHAATDDDTETPPNDDVVQSSEAAVIDVQEKPKENLLFASDDETPIFTGFSKQTK
jgi:hypothetical protein